MFHAKAYSAANSTSPLASTTIRLRDPTPHDVQIEILFCGICHSDLHTVRNEWRSVMPTVYPCVPGHEIVGRVTRVGSAVTRFQPGDLVGVGCLVEDVARPRTSPSTAPSLRTSSSSCESSRRRERASSTRSSRWLPTSCAGEPCRSRSSRTQRPCRGSSCTSPAGPRCRPRSGRSSTSRARSRPRGTARSDPRRRRARTRRRSMEPPRG